MIARLVSKPPTRHRLTTMPHAANAGVPARGLAGLLVTAVLVCAPGAAAAEGGHALYIDEDGRVAIGKSDPAAALDVAGTAQAQRFTGDGSALTVSGSELAAVVAELRGAVRELQDATRRSAPIGTIAAYGGDTRDLDIAERLRIQGWLPCDGRSVKHADFPDLYLAIGGAFGKDERGGTFNLPDLRGRFLRGVDQGKRTDPDAGARVESGPNGNRGDAVGSQQQDELRSHQHKIHAAHAGGTGGRSTGDPPAVAGWPENWTDLQQVQPAGGNETRPKNIYVNWIIKAAHPLPPTP